MKKRRSWNLYKREAEAERKRIQEEREGLDRQQMEREAEVRAQKEREEQEAQAKAEAERLATEAAERAKKLEELKPEIEKCSELIQSHEALTVPDTYSEVFKNILVEYNHGISALKQQYIDKLKNIIE